MKATVQQIICKNIPLIILAAFFIATYCFEITWLMSKHFGGFDAVLFYLIALVIVAPILAFLQVIIWVMWILEVL
jgi:hypothetical protein